MSSFRERNDRQKPARGGENVKSDKGYDPRRGSAPPRREAPANDWLWGWHAVEAALANPAREGLRRLLATPDRTRELEPLLKGRQGLRVETAEAAEIGRALPSGAVHQGLALRADPLEGVSIEELAESGSGVILMLDQITDPQNVGAVFRSAAAFGARGVVLQDRNAPLLTGALAKAAAGAIDKIPHARVTNLSRALEKLDALGWRAVGLDGGGEASLAETLDARPTVLVLGSEGEGIRRLVAEHCDVLAKIPMPGGFESLNVSNAAAVALYEATRPRAA